MVGLPVWSVANRKRSGVPLALPLGVEAGVSNPNAPVKHLGNLALGMTEEFASVSR